MQMTHFLFSTMMQRNQRLSIDNFRSEYFVSVSAHPSSFPGGILKMKCWKISGCLVLVLLFFTQLGFLFGYVFDYCEKIPQERWTGYSYWVYSSLTMGAGFWFFISCVVRFILGILFFFCGCTSEGNLRHYSFVWLVYTVLFIVDFALVFALVEDKDMLRKERFLGPKILETVLCITPFLLLLLLNTANDDDIKHHGDFKWLCGMMTVQLFDAIDMIDIVLSEKGKGSEIPKVYGMLMIGIACASLLLSAWQLMQSVHRKSTGARGIGENIRLFLMIIINVASLTLRVIVLVKYGTNETIFIAKNVISIFTLMREMCCSTGHTYQVLLTRPDETQLGPKAALPNQSDEEEYSDS